MKLPHSAARNGKATRTAVVAVRGGRSRAQRRGAARAVCCGAARQVFRGRSLRVVPVREKSGKESIRVTTAMRVMLPLTPARRTILARAVGRRPALRQKISAARGLLLDAQYASKRRLCTQSETQLEYASSCWLPTTWVNLPLVSRHEASHDATLYKFGLPEGQSLNLPVCGCLLLRGPSDVVRPYTPVSDNSMLGGFELLVKRYPSGIVSQ
eukprot:3209399-Pleurochrysis_carterae.AAC.3